MTFFWYWQKFWIQVFEVQPIFLTWKNGCWGVDLVEPSEGLHGSLWEGWVATESPGRLPTSDWWFGDRFLPPFYKMKRWKKKRGGNPISQVVAFLKDFLFSPRKLGEDEPIWRSYFFKWVEIINQQSWFPWSFKKVHPWIGKSMRWSPWFFQRFTSPLRGETFWHLDFSIFFWWNL